MLELSRIFIQSGSKIIVVSQHWLWLYDLYKLGEVHREYKAINKSDGRLNPERDGSGGFGGIRILWH